MQRDSPAQGDFLPLLSINHRIVRISERIPRGWQPDKKENMPLKLQASLRHLSLRIGVNNTRLKSKTDGSFASA